MLLREAEQTVPLDDWEYLIHHIEVDSDDEEVHHCFLYDHIANLFQTKHLLIQGGKAFLDGEEVPEGVFHVVTGLEPEQEISWSDQDAIGNGIRPKAMVAGMTAAQKAQEW